MLRSRQKFGKYRIERRLGQGGFATVYQALDTIDGSKVALKIPHAPLVTKEVLEDFYREARMAARLDHPNILALRNADFIDQRFVAVTALGRETLADRLQRRLSVRLALSLVEQAITAVAVAHRNRIIHCDIKPENLILFPGNLLRLADFGIARVAQRTVRASGSGTVGYVAPEQAMGRPSQRSDVFSLGLVIYRTFSGRLPEWPFDWPPVGYEVLQKKLHPELIALIRRAIELDPRKRFGDADQMLEAFLRIKPRVFRFLADRSRGRVRTRVGGDWREVQKKQFLRRFGKQLATRDLCRKCSGPVSEAMHCCPWCGTSRKVHRGDTSFPCRCPRCSRGMKLDWRFCPWCFGAGFETHPSREYSDVRYVGRCSNPRCKRKHLMAFSRYCPWCRRKVRRKWKIEGLRDKCSACGWGVASDYWSHCPWCTKSLTDRRS